MPLFLGILGTIAGGIASAVTTGVGALGSAAASVAAPVLKGAGALVEAGSQVGQIAGQVGQSLQGLGGLVTTVRNLVDKPDSPRRQARRAASKLQAQQEVLRARGQLRAPGTTALGGGAKVGDVLARDVVDFDGRVIPAGSVIPLGRALGPLPPQGASRGRRGPRTTARGENTFSRFANGFTQVDEFGRVVEIPRRLSARSVPPLGAVSRSQVIRAGPASVLFRDRVESESRQDSLSRFGFQLGVQPALKKIAPITAFSRGVGTSQVSFGRGEVAIPQRCPITERRRGFEFIPQSIEPVSDARADFFQSQGGACR